MNELCIVVGIVFAIGVVLSLLGWGVRLVLESRRLRRRSGERFAQRIYLRYEVLKMFAGFFIAVLIDIPLAYFAITGKCETCGKAGFFVMLGAIGWAIVAGKIYLANLAQGECPQCANRMKFFVGDVDKELECERCGHIQTTRKPTLASTKKKRRPTKIDVSGLD